MRRSFESCEGFSWKGAGKVSNGWAMQFTYCHSSPGTLPQLHGTLAGRSRDGTCCNHPELKKPARQRIDCTPQRQWCCNGMGRRLTFDRRVNDVLQDTFKDRIKDWKRRDFERKTKWGWITSKVTQILGVTQSYWFLRGHFNAHLLIYSPEISRAS